MPRPHRARRPDAASPGCRRNVLGEGGRELARWTATTLRRPAASRSSVGEAASALAGPSPGSSRERRRRAPRPEPTHATTCPCCSTERRPGLTRAGIPAARQLGHGAGESRFRRIGAPAARPAARTVICTARPGTPPNWPMRLGQPGKVSRFAQKFPRIVRLHHVSGGKVCQTFWTKALFDGCVGRADPANRERPSWRWWRCSRRPGCLQSATSPHSRTWAVQRRLVSSTGFRCDSRQSRRPVSTIWTGPNRGSEGLSANQSNGQGCGYRRALGRDRMPARIPPTTW